METVAQAFDKALSEYKPEIIKPPLPSIITTPFENHWNKNLTDAQYHGDKTAIGSSSLRKFGENQRKYYLEINKQEEDKDCFRFGTAVHCAILEHEKFKKSYRVLPDFGDGRTTAGKAAKAEHERQCLIDPDKRGALWLKQEEFDSIVHMAENLLAHPDGANIIKNCAREVVGYYVDPATKILTKIKPDILSFDGTILADLKTTAKGGDIEDFAKTIAYNDYHIQVAMYAYGCEQITGKKVSDVAFIVFEKSFPYDCFIHILNPHALELGKRIYHDYMGKLKKAIETNIFERPQIKTGVVDLPHWYYMQKEEF